MRLNEHLEHDDGEAVFRHACKMGLEGIVSKRLGSRYRSGRSPDWLKFKNPDAPAVRREKTGANDFRSPDHGAAAEPNGFRRVVRARDAPRSRHRALAGSWLL